MIVFRFVKEDKLDSALIRWYSFSDWNHVDFALPDGRFLGARLGGGVAIRPANYIKPERSLYLGVQLPAEQERAVMQLAYAQLGKPYNIAGIFGFPLNRDFNDGKRFFCSQFGQWVFWKNGMPLVRVNYADRVTPGMLASSMLLHPVPSAVAA